ncbi:hypothetical protein FQN54_007980 [Arachnomyces sp. PD_36]|nr:hypothetical protein FQN54_007980 [Arachnomyces sp. PD_36]
MSTTTTTTPTPPDRAAEYVKFKHYAALTFLFASPVLIALPPRKLDFYTFSLGGAFLLSSNHITRERTGRGITEHLSSFSSNSFSTIPNNERAEAVRARLRAEKELKGETLGLKDAEKEKAGEQRNVVEKIWMGGEEEGWKEKRLKEEQKALDEGKGYGDLIQEHIWEVWNWGKSGEEEKKKK